MRFAPVRAALRRSSTAAVAALTLLVAGCGEDPSDDSAERASTTEPIGEGTPTPGDPVPTADESPTPSPGSGDTAGADGTAGTAGSDESAGNGDGSRSSLRQRLTPADRLPGLNETFRWRATSTTRSEPEPFARCHKVPLVAIGASEVSVRAFDNADDPTAHAGHAVAVFPDEETAKRALSVLRAWHEDCAGRLGDDVRVDPLTSVGRDAAWYLTIGEPSRPAPQTAGFEATGFARVGARVAVLVMGHDGQDYNYPPGGEPMVGAVRGATVLLR